jgi:protein-S-isoprenylcysteine O-methyltransferase Ste14
VSNKIISFVSKKIGRNIRFYRLFYNLFSTITFIPIIFYSFTIQGNNLFQWEGYFQIPRVISILISIYLFYAGAKHYDGLQFAGIRQIWVDVSVLIVNSILTLYLIIGTILEENKLVLEFGEPYRLYKKNVSMLFPYKWLQSKIKHII